MVDSVHPEAAAEAAPFHAVDRHLVTATEAGALALALDRGWIDRLVQAPAPLSELAVMAGGMPEPAARTLRSLLAAGEVVVQSASPAEPVALTPAFRGALAFRDLLEAKLWFLAAVAPDIHRFLGALLSDVPAFMAQAEVFELFRYDRCFDPTPENLALTRRWVSYTSALTRYEAPACWRRVDPAASRRLLDIGGNSGEFARQACAAAPGLEATVFDLPVVCALGREHVAGLAGGSQVRFEAGDLRADPLPGGYDLVSFKSVLHDWPQDHAATFLEKAAAALVPGGRMVIFERAPIPIDGRRLSHAMIANLVFLPFFREAGFYLDALARLGMGEIRLETVELEMPFHLVTAVRPL